MSVARKALEMTKAATEAIVQRAEARYQAHRQEIFRTTDRMFAGLMIVQWIFAIFIGIVQMLWSALLIHLTGARIETHFHVFGSLAFLSFYRDWPVLITGTVVVATDHLLRGILWPESVYGIPNPEWWRFLEHAFWVVFCISILVPSCFRGVKDMRVMADRGAELEALSENQWRNSSVVDRAANDPTDG